MSDHVDRGPFAIAIAIVLVLVLVALVATGAIGSSSRHLSPEELAATHRIDALLDGIPQSGNLLGDPSAPVTLQLFGTIDCPQYREFVGEAMPSLIRRWIRPGKLRIEFRSLQEGSDPEEEFVRQQVAALAAGRQGRLWNYLEFFFNEQERQSPNDDDSCSVAEDYPQIAARQVPGLSLARWTRELRNRHLASQVLADVRTAEENGFAVSPSFLIGRSGTRTASDPVALSLENTAVFERAIEPVLNDAIEALLAGRAPRAYH